MTQIARLVATVIAAMGLCGTSTSAGPTVSLRDAVGLWQRREFAQAYNAFLVYARSAQFGRAPTPVYYLLTAGCRSGDTTVMRWSKQVLTAYANDQRIQSVSAWSEVFTREARSCGTSANPGLPPMRKINSNGVELDEPLPVNRLSMALKRRILGLDEERPAASEPVVPDSDTLPADVLALPKGGDRVAIQARLRRQFGGSVEVGKDLILLGADPNQQFSDTPALAEAFLTQIEGDLGLPAPSGYMFMIVYNDDAGDAQAGIPIFPGNEFSLGYSDSRVLTSYVLATPRQHGTVFHELIHQLVLANVGDMAPEWLNEGLASLYEQTAQVGGRFVGVPNWRGGFLRNVRDRPSLEKIVGDAPFLNGQLLEEPGIIRSMITEAGAMNAGERYLMLYLQEKNLIPQVVHYYRDLSPGIDSDWPLATREARLSAFKRATGIDPVAGNAAFQSWLATTVTRQPASSFEIPLGPSPRSTPSRRSRRRS